MAEEFDIIIDFANLVQMLTIGWKDNVDERQMQDGGEPVKQVATEITNICNTPEIKEKIKDKRVNIKIIFSYSGKGSLKAFQTAVADRTQPEREKTYNDPNIGAINNAITNDLDRLPDDEKPGKGFSIDWIWAGKMTESYAKEDTEKNTKIKDFDCTAKPPNTPDDFNGYSKLPVHTCESPDDLLVIYYVAKALKETRDCIVISNDAFRSEYYLINGCIGAGKNPSDISIKDIIAKCKLNDLWTQPNNQPRFWDGNSRKWHVFRSALSDYDQFYDVKFDYKQALESILSGNQFKVTKGGGGGKNSYTVLKPPPDRPNHPPDLNPESSAEPVGADDPGAICTRDDQLGPVLFSLKNQYGKDINPETCDIIRSERAGADAAPAAGRPAAAAAVAVADVAPSPEPAPAPPDETKDHDLNVKIFTSPSGGPGAFGSPGEIESVPILMASLVRKSPPLKITIKSNDTLAQVKNKIKGIATVSDSDRGGNYMNDSYTILRLFRTTAEASPAAAQEFNNETWISERDRLLDDSINENFIFTAQKPKSGGGGRKKTKRKKKRTNKRSKTRKNRKNKSRKNKTKKFKPKMPGAFGDNVTLQLEFPNKSIRWVWLVKIRDDDRFVIRSPKIGVLVRELKLKRDKDFGPEKLAPKGTKIFSKK
jgi:hypothetical protein